MPSESVFFVRASFYPPLVHSFLRIAVHFECKRLKQTSVKQTFVMIHFFVVNDAVLDDRVV